MSDIREQISATLQDWYIRVEADTRVDLGGEKPGDGTFFVECVEAEDSSPVQGENRREILFRVHDLYHVSVLVDLAVRGDLANLVDNTEGLIADMGTTRLDQEQIEKDMIDLLQNGRVELDMEMPAEFYDQLARMLDKHAEDGLDK